jgi:DNA invertase Pin-like site-specific DNA recombinase
MRKIGYLRVSTEDQRPDRQIDGLRELCNELHIEVISGAAKRRPIYKRALSRLRKGDQLVVWDLDRAYRCAAEALTELDRLLKRGVQIHIVKFAIDTTTPTGKFAFTLMAGLSEFERGTLSLRTREGLAAARRRGVTLGRPRKLGDAALRRIRSRIETRMTTIAEVAREHGVAPWTVSRSLRRLDSR